MGVRYNTLLFIIVLLMVLVGFFVSAHLMFGDKIPVSARFLLRERGAPGVCTERALPALCMYAYACMWNGFVSFSASVMVMPVSVSECLQLCCRRSHSLSLSLTPSHSLPLFPFLPSSVFVTTCLPPANGTRESDARGGWWCLMGVNVLADSGG